MTDTASTDIAGPHWKPQDLIGNWSLREFLFSNDYRIIAVKGILTALAMLALAGVFALTFRAELTVPDIQFFGARTYMGLMTVHGMLNNLQEIRFTAIARDDELAAELFEFDLPEGVETIDGDAAPLRF